MNAGPLKTSFSFTSLQDETDGDVEMLGALLTTFLFKSKDAKKKSKLAEKVWPKPARLHR